MSDTGFESSAGRSCLATASMVTFEKNYCWHPISTPTPAPSFCSHSHYLDYQGQINTPDPCWLLLYCVSSLKQNSCAKHICTLSNAGQEWRGMAYSQMMLQHVQTSQAPKPRTWAHGWPNSIPKLYSGRAVTTRQTPTPQNGMWPPFWTHPQIKRHTPSNPTAKGCNIVECMVGCLCV